MRILFRCDGGPGIGAGHVVRCVALAEEAVARGHQVAFAGTFTGDFLESLVADLGTRATILGPVSETGSGALADLAGSYDVVHVDHYAVHESLLDELGARKVAGDMAGATGGDAPGRPGRRPLVSNMCDGAFGARPADVVIDPTPGAEERPSGAPAGWSLRGGRFSPVRRDILRARPPAADTSPELGPGAAPLRVLVVMGGTDPLACAPLVVDALAETALPLDVTVVSTPDTDAGLRARQAWWGPGTLEVTPPVPDLPQRMARADLVVTAAGTSLWELCALRAPMAAVMVVENQRTGYELVVGADAAVGLGGPAALEDRSRTAADLKSALSDASVRAGLADRAGRLVDGLGAWRVVASWEAIRAGATPRRARPQLAARAAVMTDAELLWRWRNDPSTRASSRSSGEVPWSDHLGWLAASLERDDRVLLVAEDDAGPVGTIRWDHLPRNEWEVSITVAPERRGQGLAAALLAAGESSLEQSNTGCTGFLATVHSSNTASERLFLGSGYLPERPPDERGFARYYKSAGPAAPAPEPG